MNLQKVRQRKNSERSQRGEKNTPPIEQRKELHLTFPQNPYKQEDDGVIYLKC
jgi:hypothetical protein